MTNLTNICQAIETVINTEVIYLNSKNNEIITEHLRSDCFDIRSDLTCFYLFYASCLIPVKKGRMHMGVKFHQAVYDGK